jgi:hypothetical protein
MPPTAARSDFGHFGIGAPPSPTEIEVIHRWANGNASEGTPPPDPPKIWSVPDGDVLVTFATAPIAPGGVPFRRILSANFPLRDIVARGFEVKPKSPRAIRQIVFATSLSDGDIDLSTLVGAWAFGYGELSFPAGVAVSFPAGSTLYASVTYTPTGKTEDGGFDVHVTTAPSELSEPGIVLLDSGDLSVPVSPHFNAVATATVPNDCEALAVLPFASFLAQDVSLVVIDPNGRQRTLFESDRWNPDWTGAYRFATPVRIQAGSRITASVRFDNSTHNPRNPNQPPAIVPDRFKVCLQIAVR